MRTKTKINKVVLMVVLALINVPCLAIDYYFDADMKTEIWKRTKSPYVLYEDMVIPANKRLVIEPGVIIALGPGVKIQVNGQLIAIGGKANNRKIIFTSDKDKNYLGKLAKVQAFKSNRDEWDGITFANRDDNLPSILSNCILRFGNKIIASENSFPIFERIKIERNRQIQIKMNGEKIPIRPGFQNYGEHIVQLAGNFINMGQVSWGDTVAINLLVKNSGRKTISQITMPLLLTDSHTQLYWIKRETKFTDLLYPFQEDTLKIAFTINGHGLDSLILKTILIGKSVDKKILYASEFITSVLQIKEKEIPLAPPQNLHAESVTDSSLVLSWDDNSENEKGFAVQAKYSVEWTTLGEVEKNINKYRVNNLNDLTEYLFRVFSFNENDSSYSDTIHVKTREKKVLSEKIAKKSIFKKWWFWASGSAGMGVAAAIILSGSSKKEESKSATDLPGPPGLP